MISAIDHHCSKKDGWLPTIEASLDRQVISFPNIPLVKSNMETPWPEIMERREKESERYRFATAVQSVETLRNRLSEVEDFLSRTDDYGFVVPVLRSRIRAAIQAAIDLSPPSSRQVSGFDLLQHLNYLYQYDWESAKYYPDSVTQRHACIPTLREMFQSTFDSAINISSADFNEIIKNLENYFDRPSPGYTWAHVGDSRCDWGIYVRRDAENLLNTLVDLIKFCERLIGASADYQWVRPSEIAHYPAEYEKWIAEAIRGTPPNEVEEVRLELGDYTMDELDGMFDETDANLANPAEQVSVSGPNSFIDPDDLPF